MKEIDRFFLFFILTLLLVGCGGAAAVETPRTEEPSSTEPATTEFPDSSTSMPSSTELGQQLANIDLALKQAMSGKIAYNAPPDELQLEDTVTIELLISLSLSEEQLVNQLSEPGNTQSEADVEITPEMKAEVLAPADAFAIQPIHADPIQLVGTTETTKWSWHVTAAKPGTHPLTIVIYRHVIVNEAEHWREVAAYTTKIDVKTSSLSQLRALDWKWIAGTLIALLAIAGFVRQYTRVRNLRSSFPGKEIAGHLFISYRRSDSVDITGRIYDRLVEEFGREPIFKDVDSIPLGTDFKEYLDRKVSECDVFLAIIGDTWLNTKDNSGKRRLDDPSDFVRIEIESALGKGIPVIPLLVGGAQMPEEQHLPEGLRKLVFQNGIQVRPDPDFHRDMNRLISALESYIR